MKFCQSLVFLRTRSGITKLDVNRTQDGAKFSCFTVSFVPGGHLAPYRTGGTVSGLLGIQIISIRNEE